MTRNIALEVPALDGLVVTQAHADYCSANGHSTHTISGVVQPYCPRCGEVAHPEAFPSREETAELIARIEAEQAAERAELDAEDAAAEEAARVAATVVLNQTASWNSGLRNAYRTRYGALGGRYFRACAGSLSSSWEVEEIAVDGEILDWVGSARNLNEIRGMIARRVL